MAISLGEAEYELVQPATAPVHPRQRAEFLAALAAELARHSVIGPGLVHRLAGDLQHRFVVEARGETANAEARPRLGA